MNGAELLVKTAHRAGIEICFTNPGTTELPIVSAFDTIPGIRPILGLFEGCCTGAADGYGRMADKPAMTLLHLGPGLGNGIANLHNARRARTPVFNVIGDHASWHIPADAPLTMDIAGLAKTVSGWLRNNQSANDIARDTGDAIAASQYGQIATLIVSHDSQWDDCSDNYINPSGLPSGAGETGSIQQAADSLLSEKKSVLLLGGRALRKRGLMAAARIHAATGCRLLAETFAARMERGAGLPAIDRIPYNPKYAADLLSQFQSVVLAGAAEPVAFFGYKGLKSRLLDQNQEINHLAGNTRNIGQTLEYLADALGAPKKFLLDRDIFPEFMLPQVPKGKLTAQHVGMTLAALQPENTIIVDESVTTGRSYFALTGPVRPHTILFLTGGAIGQGMPCAVGAATACPDRPVINLQADGSAMYTLQALWMQAREGLNITTLICSNRGYEILKIELARAGHTPPGNHAQMLTDLGNPAINWLKISQGLGVPAVGVDTCEKLARQLKGALSEPGPHLIEMQLA